MYKKLRFVEQPETKKRFLGIVSDTDDNSVIYAYPKVADNFKTARMHLALGEYNEATAGFLAMQKQDSTKTYIEEYELNKMGYRFLRDKKFDKAVGVFKMNVVLFPKSDNVYDSLGEAYLEIKDSLNAYQTFKQALELNSGNKRAKSYVEIYNKNHK